MESVWEYSWSQLSEAVESFRDASALSSELRAGWRRARAAGALRYDVRELQTRTVPGAYTYLLQLNPSRATERRAAAPVHHIRQQFDPDRFNFTLVPPAEVLLRLRCRDRGEEVHSVLVNASPISELHSLFCPHVQRRLPQVVTEDSLVLALELYFLAADRDLRIAFNSLCALASVNHLHYHLLAESGTLPVEVAECDHLAGPLYCFRDYPIPAFCFQVKSKQSIGQTCRDVYKLLHFLLEKDIAHNLMITRGRGVGGDGCEVARVVVWPRRSSYGAKQFDAFNVAVCEMSGWFPVFDEKHFNNLQASDIEKELRSWRLDTFQDVVKAVKVLYQDEQMDSNK